MANCFTNGQRIRHTIGINKTWIGIYDASKNEIICDSTLDEIKNEIQDCKKIIMKYSNKNNNKIKTIKN